ncbi:MAG TPA: outer membrane beta-barrel protein [Candidatus Manganitrophaceae bacterium]|nr:outer membrane beta-barrel protein [Candidatus Manganitrophaceae bacterium]
MNKRAWFLWMTVLFLFAGIVQEAGAEEGERKWGVGLRGGASFLSQEIDLTGSVKGKTGPMVGGDLLYRLNDLFSLGLDVEWEKHRVTALGFDIGDATAFSLIPFVSLHGYESGAFSPYGLFGLGVNINSFRIADSNLLSRADPDNTMAVKIGLGADYFATRHLALNTEIGWKLNLGEAALCAPAGCSSPRWNTSAFTALVGLRYYF